MRAWIVFNQLVPLIENKLKVGVWPKDSSHKLLKSHPAFNASEFTIYPACFRVSAAEEIDLNKFAAENGAELLKNGKGVKIKTPDGKYAYAALLPITSKAMDGGLAGSYSHLSIDVTPLKGSVFVAILDKDKQHFLSEGRVGSDFDTKLGEKVNVLLPLNRLDGEGWLIVTNLQKIDEASEALISNVHYKSSANKVLSKGHVYK